MLRFLRKRGQRGNRESYILLENGPTPSLIASVHRLQYANFEERCGRGYDRCVQTLLPDVVAPETYRNSLREFEL